MTTQLTTLDLNKIRIEEIRALDAVGQRVGGLINHLENARAEDAGQSDSFRRWKGSLQGKLGWWKSRFINARQSEICEGENPVAIIRQVDSGKIYDFNKPYSVEKAIEETTGARDAFLQIQADYLGGKEKSPQAVERIFGDPNYDYSKVPSFMRILDIDQGEDAPEMRLNKLRADMVQMAGIVEKSAEDRIRNSRATQYLRGNWPAMAVGFGTSFVTKMAFTFAAAQITHYMGPTATHAAAQIAQHFGPATIHAATHVAAVVTPLVLSAATGAMTRIATAYTKARHELKQLDKGWKWKAAKQGMVSGLIGGVLGEGAHWAASHFHLLDWMHPTAATAPKPPVTTPTAAPAPVASASDAPIPASVSLPAAPAVHHTAPAIVHGMDKQAAAYIDGLKHDAQRALDSHYLDDKSAAAAHKAAEDILKTKDVLRLEADAETMAAELMKRANIPAGDLTPRLQLASNIAKDGAGIGWTHALVDKFKNNAAQMLESTYRSIIRGKAGGMPMPQLG